MDNNSHFPSNPQAALAAAPGKDMSWNDVLLSISGGYVCLVLFFILARLTAPDLLFSGWQFEFSERLYYSMVVVFLIAYTVYGVNKVIWFAFRKNRYGSAIYGSIRRFLTTYVWCLYIGFVPFVFLTSLLPSNSPFYPWYFNEFSWNMHLRDMAMLVFCLYCSSIMLSSCLVPLIPVQRLIITCHRVATHKPIGKPEANVQFWQFAEAPVPVTLYSILRYFVSTIREVGYWFAILILLITIPVINMSIQPSAVGNHGNGWAAMGAAIMIVTFAYFVIVAICCLAFSIIVRRLFGVISLLTRRTLPRSTG